MLSWVEIDVDNLRLLKQFLGSVGNSSEYFRYYRSRDIKVVEDHLFTCLLLKDGNPVGYGHLDPDNSDRKIWLGIMVAENGLEKEWEL